MDANPSDLAVLLEEYEEYLPNTMEVVDEHSWDHLKDKLVANGEWTNAAADHLVWLIRNYGSFMLRNAAALALAMNIEDGELGF